MIRHFFKCRRLTNSAFMNYHNSSTTLKNEHVTNYWSICVSEGNVLKKLYTIKTCKVNFKNYLSEICNFVWIVLLLLLVDWVWNVMAHAQKPDFVFRQNWRIHLNRQGRQFSRLLAAEVCASAVVMLDTPCSEVVWRGLATHTIRQFPLHYPSSVSLCAITFQLDYNNNNNNNNNVKSDGTQHTKARLREILKEKWKNKVMHGQYIRNIDRKTY